MTKLDGFRATLPIAMLAVILGATCGDQATPTPPDRTPAPGGNHSGDPVIRDGIEYRADLLVMESFPVQLAGRVSAKNTTAEPRTITFPDGCVVLMRAYILEGGSAVWDQSGEVGCTMALVPVDLAPGEERVLPAAGASADEILGTDLPDGQYRITLYLRPIENDTFEAAKEIELEAGTTDLAISR